MYDAGRFLTVECSRDQYNPNRTRLKKSYCTPYSSEDATYKTCQFIHASWDFPGIEASETNLIRKRSMEVVATTLPHELWEFIFSFLHPIWRGVARSVHKSWRDLFPADP